MNKKPRAPKKKWIKNKIFIILILKKILYFGIILILFRISIKNF
jgi:hypothetical protein